MLWEGKKLELAREGHICAGGAMRGERARASKGGSDICWGEFWEGRGLVQDGGGGNICAGGGHFKRGEG